MQGAVRVPAHLAVAPELRSDRLERRGRIHAPDHLARPRSLQEGRRQSRIVAAADHEGGAFRQAIGAAAFVALDALQAEVVIELQTGLEIVHAVDQGFDAEQRHGRLPCDPTAPPLG